MKTREGRIGQKARRSYQVGPNWGNRPVDRLRGGDDLLLTAAGERSDRNAHSRLSGCSTLAHKDL